MAAQLFDRATLDLSKKSVQPLIYLYISFFFESLTHSAGVTNRGNDSSTYTSFCLAGVFYTHWAARSTGNRSFADRVAFTVILIARISSRSTGDSASSAAWALTQPQNPNKLDSGALIEAASAFVLCCIIVFRSPGSAVNQHDGVASVYSAQTSFCSIAGEAL